MSLSSNFPTIKPSLNLDFANVGRLDPRVTFTRASTATYYDGVTTAVAEQNLLLRSQDYSTSWTVTNLTPVTGKTAPDGTSTATEFTAGAANAVLTQGYTAVAGSYTFSVWLRRVTGTGDIEIAADNGTWTTKVITGTWARYDVTQTVTAGSKTAGVRVVTSGDAIEVWGAQLEQRSSVTAYTATTTQPITNYIPVLLTAQNDVPRFDHNPTTGAALGLLIEEQRTNLETYSEDFSNAVWVKTNSTISSNAIIAPSGQLTGDKLIADATTSIHSMTIPSRVYTINVAYAMSIFAKAGEYNTFSIIRSGPGGASARFDLSTLTATVIAGTSASITSVGNGWYRCEMTWTSTQTIARTHELRLENPSGTSTFLGDGYSGMFFWGIQTEAGAFATSYIPTTTTALTRSADAASMTGTNFSSWFNAAEGTLYADAQLNAIENFKPIFNFNDGTSSNLISLQTSTPPASRVNVVANGSSQVALGPGNLTVNTQFKMSMAYKTNDFAAVLNGGTVQTDTAGVVPVLTQAEFLKLLTATSNGTIRKLAYYPQRLSDAQLQALTG